MKKIFIFTNNYFIKKDFLRFEVDDLSHLYDVYIVSINKKIKIKNNKIKILHVKYFSDLNKINFQNENNFAIDLMGIDRFSWQVRFFLQENKVKLIRMFLSITPYPKPRNVFLRILLNLIPNKTSGGSLIRKIKNNTLIYLNRYFKYDFIFVAGSVANKMAIDKKPKKIIKFKSFDTLIYEKKKNLINLKKPIVFIDNDIADHPDYLHHGTTSPVNKEKYYYSLNHFFNYIEKKFNTNVVIAAHPKSNLKKATKQFNNRKVIQNKTSDLIKKCSFTILHHSTALSFCILSNKPTLFITNDDIKKSWFQKEIEFGASILKNKIFNIEHFNKYKNINKYLTLNKKNYQIYKNKYLYSKKINKNLTLTKILHQHLK